MRRSQLLIAGTLLSVAVFLLVCLFSPPSYQWAGVSSTLFFVPLWCSLTAVYAGFLKAAGVRVRRKAYALCAVLGLPIASSLALWWANVTLWEEGPLIAAGRTPVMLITGVVLWAVVRLLGTRAALKTCARARRGPSLTVFLPLWLLITGVNLLLGVFVAGYTWGEELLVLGLNLTPPGAVVLIDERHLRCARSRGATARNPEKDMNARHSMMRS